MIQLPKRLHRLKIFEQGGRRYVADIDREYVFPISDIQAEILKRAEELSVPQLINWLKDRYEEPSVFQALTQLERWEKLGLIFSPFMIQQPISKDRPYRIFVMHDLLYWPPPSKHPANALQNYQLITELAKRLSINFAIPQEKQDEFNFGETGVQKLPIKSGRVFSPIWYAAKESYDAVLAIAPGYFEDLPFYCQSEVPVLARIHSEGWEKEAIWNAILAKAALTRPYDALIVDASWVKTELSLLLPNVTNVIFIPDGIDLQQFQPISSSQAKKAISQGLEISMIDRPMVGFVGGMERDENLRIISWIAYNHPEWTILLYDETLPPRLTDFPENIRFFGARQFEDPFLLPIILNGLDILFFCATVGAPARILAGAMACGVPLVVSSRDHLLELDESFPYIPLEKNQVWKDRIPWEKSLRTVTDLLANQEKRLELAERAKQRAAHLAWDRRIEQWIQLIEQLKTARDLECLQQRPRQSLLFCRWYDKGQGTVQSQAVSWESLSRQSLEDGLAEDLLSEHTPTEVSLVLQKLLGTVRQPIPSQTISLEDSISLDANTVIDMDVQKTSSMAEESVISEQRSISSLGEHIENQLADKAKSYPHATDYLKKYFEKSRLASPYVILSRLQSYFQRSEILWQHFDEVIADILQVTGWSTEELFNQPPIELTEEQPSFQAIKEKWYETPYYPVSEHLNYIDFEPALERARFILKHLNQLEWKEAIFLDLGFGPGVLTSLILQTKPHWQGYGIDVSFSCYKYAQKLLTLKGVADRAHLLVGDVRQLPYLDKSFDLVVGMEVFEHISNPRKGLFEAVRVLKPGGYMITAVPVRLPLKMHLYVFKDVQEVLELYKGAGLKVLDFQEKEYQLPLRKFVDTFVLSTLIES